MSMLRTLGALVSLFAVLMVAAAVWGALLQYGVVSPAVPR